MEWKTELSSRGMRMDNSLESAAVRRLFVILRRETGVMMSVLFFPAFWREMAGWRWDGGY